MGCARRDFSSTEKTTAFAGLVPCSPTASRIFWTTRGSARSRNYRREVPAIGTSARCDRSANHSLREVLAITGCSSLSTSGVVSERLHEDGPGLVIRNPARHTNCGSSYSARGDASRMTAPLRHGILRRGKRPATAVSACSIPRQHDAARDVSALFMRSVFCQAHERATTVVGDHYSGSGHPILGMPLLDHRAVSSSSDLVSRRPASTFVLGER